MTMVPQNQPTPPPGWYPNAHGQQQWWDGRGWGPLAPVAQPQVYLVRAKESGTAYLFAILLGGFAAHRFYLNLPGSAIAFLILWWGGWALSVFVVGIFMVIAAGIWWIVDLFLIPGMVRTANGFPRA